MLCNLTKLFACMATTIEGKQSHHYGGGGGAAGFPPQTMFQAPPN